ncbi:hypothetical protein HKCCE2091_08580 [Rhodobacterales bacterium HKCCE2091]|nr:hypothetical protein [Rhodobacterales bacterium HKCCE2091]
MPDEENPEWTDEDFRWSVFGGDFEGSPFKVAEFLKRREEFLRSAEAIGIPRETFLPFQPNKPGFEERAKVLLKLGEAVGWAAE